MDKKLGVLAYGSLIDNPGDELIKLEVERIPCVTPFKVEFSRLSTGRGDAPTLIPVVDGGNYVLAQIIVLSNDTDVEEAKTILYRREINRVNSKAIYKHEANPDVNKVVIKTLYSFNDVELVLYTSIGSNIIQPLTTEFLAKKAISSILSPAGAEKRDGIRYLRNAKKNGIVAPLSPDYEKLILIHTETSSLEEAIIKLDRQRGDTLGIR